MSITYTKGHETKKANYPKTNTMHETKETNHAKIMVRTNPNSGAYSLQWSCNGWKQRQAVIRYPRMSLG